MFTDIMYDKFKKGGKVPAMRRNKTGKCMKSGGPASGARATDALKDALRRSLSGRDESSRPSKDDGFHKKINTDMAKKSITGMKKGGPANKKFIQGMHLKEGALHRSLGVPEGKKIPDRMIKKAEHSKNKTVARRARTAEMLKGLRHK